MDNVQHQRLELKYLIREQTAQAVRDFVASYLALDKFGVGQPDCSYTIHSLYLDSDDFEFYWQTINGNKNRYKLRLRYYDDNPSSPVFFEIKRRMNNAILKERGAVKREAANALLAGQLPDASQLASDDPGQMEALENFCRLMAHHRARPRAHIVYRREAWTTQNDNSARVTMDRQVRFDYEPRQLLRTELNSPYTVFPNSVILELKFTGRFPDWFSELVRCFNLWQGSAAKYVDGLTVMMDSVTDFDLLAGQPVPETQERFELRRETVKKIQTSELALQ